MGKRWKPKIGEKYWYILDRYEDSTYMEAVKRHFDKDLMSDTDRVKFHNCYKTKKDTMIMIKRIQVLLKKGI